MAVKKAGLRAVLCDMALEDFNIDENSLPGVISSKTLAVVGGRAGVKRPSCQWQVAVSGSGSRLAVCGAW